MPYVCPECGSKQVTIRKQCVIVEHWDGDDFSTDTDDSYEREPVAGTVECDVCGGDSDDIEEWWED